MVTYVYVDGLNLFHGALKGSPYKWLDLSKLCSFILYDHNIEAIKYYTAHVKDLPTNRGQRKRQLTYLRALETIPHLEIVRGRFQSKPTTVYRPNQKPRFVRGLTFEEKRSDVNLASDVLHDAHLGKFDVAAIITNDADLRRPIQIVTEEIGLPVIIINPFVDGDPSYDLKRFATKVRTIRRQALKKSQFPDQLQDSRGKFQKPNGW